MERFAFLIDQTSYYLLLQTVTLGTPLEWDTLLLLFIITDGSWEPWGPPWSGIHYYYYLLLQMGTLGTPLEWDTLQLLSIITDGNPEDPPGEGYSTITIYYYRWEPWGPPWSGILYYYYLLLQMGTLRTPLERGTLPSSTYRRTALASF